MKLNEKFRLSFILFFLFISYGAFSFKADECKNVKWQSKSCKLANIISYPSSLLYTSNASFSVLNSTNLKHVLSASKVFLTLSKSTKKSPPMD